MRGRDRVEGMVGQKRAIDDGAEIIAIKQRQRGRPHALLCGSDGGDEPRRME